MQHAILCSQVISLRVTLSTLRTQFCIVPYGLPDFNSLKKDLHKDKINIYITRVSRIPTYPDPRNPNYKNPNQIRTSDSKPCSHCIEVLKRIGVKKVYYTTGDILTDPTAWRCEKVNSIHSTHISVGNRRFSSCD